MIDYILSNTIKKYLKEHKIILPDKMAAALICRRENDAGMEEMHEALREIQERTEDAGLKAQIRGYIEDDLANLAEFRESGSGDFYMLSVWGESEVLEYYKAYEPAEHAARTLGERCKVRKRHAVQKAGDDFLTGAGYRDEAEFDEDGRLCFVSGSSNHFWEFDQKYYVFPHPYKRGDILEGIGNKGFLYIVTEDADPAVAEAEQKRLAPLADFSDITISVTGIERATGRIWDSDGGMHPYDFEYAQIDPGTKDLAERIMLEMQRLLMGKRGSVQYIYDACLRLREDSRESEQRVMLITGVELRPRNVGDV